VPLGLDVAVLSGRRNAATERDVWSLSGVELPGDETMSGRRNAAAGRNMRTVGAMCDRQHDVLFGSRFEPADLGACPAREIVPADLCVTVLSRRRNAAAGRNMRTATPDAAMSARHHGDRALLRGERRSGRCLRAFQREDVPVWHGATVLSGRHHAAAGRYVRTAAAMSLRLHDVLFGSGYLPAWLGAGQRGDVPADLCFTVLSGRRNAAAERNVRDEPDAAEYEQHLRDRHALLPARKSSSVCRPKSQVLSGGNDS